LKKQRFIIYVLPVVDIESATEYIDCYMTKSRKSVLSNFTEVENCFELILMLKLQVFAFVYYVIKKPGKIKILWYQNEQYIQEIFFFNFDLLGFTG